jgi:hypothetical protein
MIFPRKQRTLPSKPRNEEQDAKPRKWLIMPLKHASSRSDSINTLRYENYAFNDITASIP